MHVMAERTGICSLLDGELSSSSLLTYLNVAERLRLMSVATRSPEVRGQLQEIAETYEKLAALCSNFKNLKARLSITGPILPDPILAD